jgi:hypothetical protein
MVKLVGFAPDQPVQTAGIMADCESVIPTELGFAGAPSPVAVPGVGVLSTSARGGAIGTATNGTRRIFVGTQTKLYEYSSATWSDVSKVGDYVGSSDGRWSFAQFGDYALASNGVEVIQATNSGDFASIAAAPKAQIIVTAANFVMALNTNDATYGDQGDRWWCSGIFDHTVWTPALSTQANTGRLVSGGGDITAGMAFGQQVIAYKARAMFLGSYVGGSVTWQWDQIPGEVGCIGQEAICDAAGVHVFVGEDNIWAFDGVRPRPIADGTVRQWFFDNSNPAYRYKTILSYDRTKNRVWLFYPSRSSTTCDSALIYHVANKTWGKQAISVECALTFIEAGFTFNTWDTAGASFDELPEVSFDSQYWSAGSKALGVFDTLHQLNTLTGTSTSCQFTTHDFGSDAAVSRLDRVRVTFQSQPTSSLCTGRTRRLSGGEYTEVSTSSQDDGVYDMRQTGRWHSLTFIFEGDVAFSDFDADLIQMGPR